MAQVRVRWGRVLLLGLVVVSGVGYATYPSWQDKLIGTPLEKAPEMVARTLGSARSWLEAQWRRLAGQSLEAATLLPSDTLVLITTQKLEQAVMVLSPLLSEQPSTDFISTLSQALKPDDPEQQALRQRLADLDALGIDQDRPFSLALLPIMRSERPAPAVVENSENPSLGMIGLVPVHSEDSLAALQHLLERQGRAVVPGAVGGQSALRIDQTVLALYWQRHLLFMWEPPVNEMDPQGAAPTPSGTSEAFASALLERLEHPGETLNNTPAFSQLLRAHGQDWHVLIWGAIGSSLAGLVQANEPDMANSLREIEGAALAGFHLDNFRFRIRTAATTKLSELDSLFSKRGNPDFLEQLRGRPVAVGTFALDPALALERLRSDPSTREAIAQLEAALASHQLRLKEDLAGALEGTGGMALLPVLDGPAQESLMARLLSAAGRQSSALAGSAWPAAGVFWLELKDANRMKDILPLLPLERTQEGVSLGRSDDALGTWVEAGLLGVGVSTHHLLVTIGPGSLTYLREMLSKGTPGVPDRAWTLLDQDVQQALERGDPGYFYLDIHQTISLLEQHPMARIGLVSSKGRAMREMLEATVRGISSRTWMDDEIWMSDYTVLGPENGISAEAEKFRRGASQLVLE